MTDLPADAAVVYADTWPEEVGREMARLRAERDEARREVKRLTEELATRRREAAAEAT